ncbi:stalk domain-containing protein [Paenibacillus thermotolerans]|uniref:stalk domain-containing protein n=1 Tax=Paenibacillus thermotolerans TaxID=3027807 RepID=UPI002367ABA0|nr:MULTISPECIES: stalk domain-containing protein [unclassified Paenibacillus]
MKIKKSVRTLLLCGACVLLAGTAAANGSISVFVDGKRLNNARIDNGTTVAPVRTLAEAMGGRVTWDQETHSVHIETQTGVTEDTVAEWIRERGKESAYYFDGLFAEEANVDADPELEVLARIDGGVHLGNFFLFDKRPDGTYKLIFERPWHVESWIAENLSPEGAHSLYKIVTRTGGTGMDVREARLMYMNDGVWTEAWTGKLKDRTVFQDNYHLVIGSYQLNDDNSQLYYWQTVTDASAETGKPTGEPKTTLKVFEWAEGRFVEMKV